MLINAQTIALVSGEIRIILLRVFFNRDLLKMYKKSTNYD